MMKNIGSMKRFRVPALLLFVVIFLQGAVSAATLVVWTDDGQQHVHDLFIVEQINFASDQLRVVTEYCTHQYPLETINRIDFLDYPTDVEDSEEFADVVKAVHLFQNYPNPFNPNTTIRFSLEKESRVTLRVFDVTGRLVANVIDGRMMAPGFHRTVWNGRCSNGAAAASGVYFYQLRAGNLSERKKMVLLK
jgi:hypothetical protein